jgi:hypothetical protein
MLFEEIITVSVTIIWNPYIQNEGLLVAEAGGTYSYYYILKG